MAMRCAGLQHSGRYHTFELHCQGHLWAPVIQSTNSQVHIQRKEA